jgi:hypothetical protein
LHWKRIDAGVHTGFLAGNEGRRPLGRTRHR